YLLVVDGDSLSAAGSQYFPANFTGESNISAGPPNSYDAVECYDGSNGGGVQDATGVKPLCTWPEKVLSTNPGSLYPAGPTQLYDSAFDGRQLTDVLQAYDHELHLTAPILTGVPAAAAIYGGRNDLSFIDGAALWAACQQVYARLRADGYYPIVG